MQVEVYSPRSRKSLGLVIHLVRMDVVAGSGDEPDGGLDSIMVRMVSRSGQGDWKVDSRRWT